jgi:hypothetical protein
MLLVFSEMMGVPNPASYYTLELQPSSTSASTSGTPAWEWSTRRSRLQLLLRRSRTPPDGSTGLLPRRAPRHLRRRKGRRRQDDHRRRAGRPPLAERGRRCSSSRPIPRTRSATSSTADRRSRQRELAPNLWGLEIDPDAQVEQHLGAVRDHAELVQPAMYPRSTADVPRPRSRPGAVEAAMLERMAELMIEPDGRFDRVIFDTAPTGHTLRLLSLPRSWRPGRTAAAPPREVGRDGERAAPHGRSEGAAVATTSPSLRSDARADAGDPRFARLRETLLERRRIFGRARRLLLDERATAFVLVLIPERLPVLETPGGRRARALPGA